jgi:hypothetical protein
LEPSALKVTKGLAGRRREAWFERDHQIKQASAAWRQAALPCRTPWRRRARGMRSPERPKQLGCDKRADAW